MSMYIAVTIGELYHLEHTYTTHTFLGVFLILFFKIMLLGHVNLALNVSRKRKSFIRTDDSRHLDYAFLCWMNDFFVDKIVNILFYSLVLFSVLNFLLFWILFLFPHFLYWNSRGPQANRTDFPQNFYCSFQCVFCRI